MKVNQEEIPRRKRGGFLENRIEEKRGKTQRIVRKKEKKMLICPDTETEERNPKKEEKQERWRQRMRKVEIKERDGRTFNFGMFDPRASCSHA